MTPANPPAQSGLPASPGQEIEGGASDWSSLIETLSRALAERGVDAGSAVVLVPYAQLMDVGRRAWSNHQPDGFAPRFESSRNWAASLQPFMPGATDLSMDMARDSLVAAAFVDRVAPARADAELRAVMVMRLVEAARQLAPLAAAVPPDRRTVWAQSLRQDLLPGPASLQWEGLVATLALTWASTSAYATDVLWSPQASPGTGAQVLVVLQGFHTDPLAAALVAHWGEHALSLSWDMGHAPSTEVAGWTLHACDDAEDEAQRAAACVIARVNQGKQPVALVATDRLLTRRISALLHGAGVTVRDETGWKLSTTYAAAQLMSLLRAASPRASMDDVLDLLKQAPRWPEEAVLTLEQLAREVGVSQWRAAVRTASLEKALPEGLVDILQDLQAPRGLVPWLDAVAQALKAAGLWDALQLDAAGQQALQVLRLEDGAARELSDIGETSVDPVASRSAGRKPLAAFTAWVRDVLEGATFMPRGTGEASVVILPMAQLLGRSFAATVVPGCDEVHLNPSPEPPGSWTAAQRELLGLPSREALAQTAASAWQALLQMPRLDVLWRTQEIGEPVMPSAWVLALQTGARFDGLDPRVPTALVSAPSARPAPSAGDVLPGALSASAYQDLRDCPYRFFAMRQLRLVDAPELEAEPDQRDMGNWLHAVLRAFHEQRGDARPGAQADRAALDQLATETAAVMGLNAGEGGAGFLPYEVVWPATRDGYLEWLATFEATADRPGPRFVQAEAVMTSSVGPWKLYGKLDRVDAQDSPEGPIPFVIDYKTESRKTTTDRLKEPLEDVQLAFYAALLPDDNLRAAYLSINDRPGSTANDGATKLVEHTEVLEAREQLRAGLSHDMARVAAGHPMPALGEGRVCEFCKARGLCRKDFWSLA
ncbi:PD-(D/E)XK nuclease family protein [Hydrogenophaga sp.]|uniref:PD-(D/E)XK nuclease family protein n=1 Tax=Hydrogenophaga sp. TaxID=1904254 RepID=UPI0027321414|nr:PD-(D/E)XK nuclease family protein [Hydrogenophaga sp.]MDP2018859.1 PD-(D/E)XK nuclease family protein [Hydrogenophaga sp.]MDP3166307.1 PD-(D/E)XK nuclease family protein [Hydrogenophaga sp.]MDP3809679.1 PD-(D/E)XK nuclease family protein [Hydrogenophaga sp.]